MQATDDAADIAAIREIMRRQFLSMNWRRDTDAQWDAFVSSFVPGALLFPAARPVKPQTVQQFVERMKRLRSDGTLESFEETLLGCEVRVFGNVAIALAGCEMLENASVVTRDVSATILVREGNRWRIAAQAWDVESELRPIPSDLARRASA